MQHCSFSHPRNDGGSGAWNPQPVTATIEFRGVQAKYTFPVGVTTLWWYAPPTGTSAQVMPAAHVATNGTVTTPIVPVAANGTTSGAIPSFTASVFAPGASESAPAHKIRGANALFGM